MSGRVTSLVRQALLEWEPRIDTIGVVTVSDVEQPTLLSIEIDYVVRATNNRFNLVYPFYLE